MKRPMQLRTFKVLQKGSVQTAARSIVWFLFYPKLAYPSTIRTSLIPVKQLCVQESVYSENVSIHKNGLAEF